MKRFVFGFLITCLALTLVVMPASAQPVTADDARSVAQNWLALTIRQQGDWGGSPTAQIGEIQEFKMGGRLIGYFCPVSPQGFLVLSLRRELAPVKAYSDTSNLDPTSDEGMTALIKEQMAATLDAIERDAGPVASVSSAAVTPLMEFNYLGAWDVLDTGAPVSDPQIEAVVSASNYQQGGVMLTTQWHQGNPFYNEVPSSPASCGDPHCPVGCVATAGAQLMAYWDWPPYGVGDLTSDTYDWPRMANQYVWDPDQNRWEDENGNPLTQANIDAVTELSHEIGVAVSMGYCSDGCSSDAFTSDMEVVYENNYRYATAASVDHRNPLFRSPVIWFSILKDQFNRNWPVHYRIYKHSIVADGWSERTIGGDIERKYHMNYGWADANNAWYTVDGLFYPAGGSTWDEYIVKNIYPAPALGWLLSGTYPAPSFPYRYFDADAWGDSATFSAGQNLQFLPGIKATCNSGTGSAIRFDGTSSANTRLFTHGDTSKGVIIRSGTLKLKPGGSVRLP